MDNHYQPLSHALHPPVGPMAQPTPAYTNPGVYPKPPATVTSKPQQEEDEEEDEEDDEEVEEQLNQENQASAPSSPKTVPAKDAQVKPPPESDKRRPGRPRGSKNRRPRGSSISQTSTKPSSTTTTFQYQTTPLHPTTSTVPIPASTAPPQHPDVNAQNQQYYDFQWRVLNLCSEFYGTAEELVKGTSPLVLAQCYQMGSGSKVDPLAMINEAKRACDLLLGNPSRLISHPPPPMYPIIPTLYPTPVAPVVAPPAPVAPTSSSSKSTTTPATVISQPQSFVVSMGGAQYPVYAANPPPPGTYAAASYYQYPGYGQPGATYYTPGVAIPQPSAAPSTSTTAGPTVPMVSSHQGPWSEAEVERLKQLVEESKTAGLSGDAAWDWIVQQWGSTRTRHQILIKGTNLGLKESSSIRTPKDPASRGVKRRRGTDDPESPVPPPAPPAPNTMSTSSPRTNSTPSASPALQNRARPSSNAATPSPATPALPWPMPTVAAATSPVIGAPSSTTTDQRATSYYRPRPSDPSKSSAAASNVTTYINYQANGTTTTSRSGK